MASAGICVKSVVASNTSVYVGTSARDYEALLFRDPEAPAKYVGTGLGTALLANRISWFYDFRGASVALDTACSSSLTAVHLACQNLRNHESRMVIHRTQKSSLVNHQEADVSKALVGGCNLILAPDVSMIHLSNMGFFSPDGQCYSFDERANGYAKGEGVGVIVLKLLSDALKDGDTIRAVIRASGANQDGRTPGITQPSKLAQEQNIRETYRLGGLDLNTTQYFEAHGTGTQVGDPIEAEAISATFQRTGHNPLLIGALKPNIGHLESASGIASLMKTVLLLENGLIPPNIGFNRANLRIPTQDWHIKVCLAFLFRRSIAHPRHKFPVEPTSWPTRGLRRASVNSFGYGGSNTHIVLDDAFNYLKLRRLEGKHCTASLPPLYVIPGVDNAGMSPHGTIAKLNRIVTINNHPLLTPKTQPQVFLLSAFDEEGVFRLATAYREFLELKSLPASEDQSSFLHHLAYTLSEKRNALPWKSFVIAESVDQLQQDLFTNLPKPIRSSTSPTVSFIFTGQGAQWARMGYDLTTYSLYRRSLEKSEEYLRSLGCRWSLLGQY